MLIAAVDLKSVGGEGIAVLCKVQLQDDSLFGVELRALVVGVKNKIAQGVEDGLVTDELIIHRNVGVVGDHDVRAHLQILEVAVPGVDVGDRRNLHATVGDDDTPAAFFFDPGDDFLNVLHGAPAEAAGFIGAGRFASPLVADAEEADPARFV